MLICVTLCTSCVSNSDNRSAKNVKQVNQIAVKMLVDQSAAFSKMSTDTIWAREIFLFRHASDLTSQLNYVNANKRLESATSDDICSEQYNEPVSQMLQYNKSSLVANYFKFACAEQLGQQALAEKYMSDLSGILQAMLLEGDGVSAEHPIIIRELNEAYVMLPLAGLDIINIEILIDNDTFLYRVLCKDQQTGEQSFRYLSNFSLFKSVAENDIKKISNRTILNQILSLYIDQKFDAALYSQSRYFMEQKKFAEANNTLASVGQGDGLRLALQAEIFLMQGDKAGLETILPTLLSAHQNGHAAVSAVLAQWLLLQDEHASAANDSKALLLETGDESQLLVHYQYLFEFLLLSDDYLAQIGRFLGDTPTDTQLQAIHQAATTLMQAGEALHQTKYLNVTNLLVDLNYAAAQFDMAWIKLRGKFGVTKNIALGLSLLQQAAGAGYADALLDSGWLASSGEFGTDINKNKALSSYQQAAAAGSAVALRNLAFYYRDGEIVDLSIDKAKEMLEQSINMGLGEAYCLLGNLYQFRLKSTDYEKIEQLYWSGILANDGNTNKAIECQYGLAVLGRNVAKNGPQAEYWFKRAGESDSISAYNALGWMYQHGELVNINVNLAVEAYQKAIDLGDATAPANLGYLYEMGELVDKDLNKAADLYQLAAERKDGVGMNNLATFYLNGTVVQQSIKKALQLYEEASLAGIGLASMNLAILYGNGDVVTKDLRLSCDYYERAVTQHYDDAYRPLAKCFEKGEGRPQSYSKALNFYEHAVINGQRLAQNELVNMLLTQYQVAADSQPVIDVLTRMAVAQDIDVNTYLGHFYYFGVNGIKYLDLARQYYEKGHQQQNAGAINNLAEMYRYGQSVEVDIGKAITLYQKAFNLNSSHAAFNLSELYETGTGVPQDSIVAFNYAKFAAEQGLIDGMFRTAEMYRLGDGVVANIEQANVWYKQAAEQGLAVAMYQWGVNLVEGIGVEADPQLGRSYLRQAAKKGNEKAKSYLAAGVTALGNVAA